jgi:chromate transport protein ChrA
LGFIAIFLPGILIKTSLLAIWNKVRTKPAFSSALKGLECGGVGLVFTAVFRLWKIGFMSQQFQNGGPIDTDAWFVLITAASFAASKWYGVKPPVAILSGGLLGMIWYGVVRPHN